jgi:hypothetical protein
MVHSGRKVPRIDSLEDWPFETCYWCGRRNNIGFVVADDIWEKVVGDPDVILCPTCFDIEAQKKNIPYVLLHHVFVTWNMKDLPYITDNGSKLEVI